MAQVVKCLPTMRETWVQSLCWEDPLKKEIATHSSTLAWKTPWTEEPGRLQTMESQRVEHDWATSLSLLLEIVPFIDLKMFLCLLIFFSHLFNIAKSLQSCPTLCDPTDCSPSGSSVHGILKQEYRSGLPFPSSGDLLNPGTEPDSLMSPALGSRFVTTITTWGYSSTCF